MKYAEARETQREERTQQSCDHIVKNVLHSSLLDAVVRAVVIFVHRFQPPNVLSSLGGRKPPREVNIDLNGRISSREKKKKRHTS
jgi:hypothetical protein